MKKALLVILGIIAGYFFSVLLSISTTYLMRSIFEVASVEHPPLYYKLFDLAYSLCYLSLAAYIATWISKSKIAPIMYGTIFLIFSILVLVKGLDTTNPVWYQVTYIILVLPITFLGGYLRLRNIEPIKQSVSTSS